MNKSDTNWQERLYTPTMIQKIGNIYFLVDCWHNRILYSNDINGEWQTLVNDIWGGHTISGNGKIFLADDTEHGSLRIFIHNNDMFIETQRIPYPKLRPYFTYYDSNKNCFYALLSGDNRFLKLDIIDNEKLIVTNDFKIPNAENTYIRSFSIIDSKIYFVSGGGLIRIIDYENFSLIKEIPIPQEFYGMNYITKSGDYFYITSYTTKNNEKIPRFVRAKKLEYLITGKYEDLYQKFGFKGTPYFISFFDGKYFITEIDQASGYTSFIIKNNNITNITNHERYENVIPSSYNRRLGGGAILYANEYAVKDIAEVKKTDTGYLIGKIRFDLSKYTGNDTYSDGDIEDELLLAAKKGKLYDLLRADKRWPVFYHVTKDRENLLDFLPANKDACALEIGSGCGAVTGILSEKFGKLETVEISPRRAEIAAWRHSDKDNITIHVGNLNDMNFEHKFDIITLIGVLEYAPSFTHTETPFEDFLSQIRSLLKEDGLLIIAIENRLGMKYFSGAAEDHLGRRFIGITGYQDVTSVKTFSKKELKDLMNEVGFNTIEWYYPYPDYKIPFAIHSDKLLPTPNELLSIFNDSWDNDRLEIFSEVSALASIIPAGLYTEFANSFLLLAKNKEIKKNNNLPASIHYSFGRNIDYSLATEFYVDNNNKKHVIKKARTLAEQKHLNAIYENYQILSKFYDKKHISEARLISPYEVEFEYVEGESLQERMQNEIKKGKLDNFLKLIDFYKENILRGTDDDSLLPQNLSPYNPNRQYDIDMNFENVVFTNDSYKIFDYEWLYPKISKNFIYWRSLYVLYVRSNQLMKKLQPDILQFFLDMGFTINQINSYYNEEQRFQNSMAETFYTRYVKRRSKVDW